MRTFEPSGTPYDFSNRRNTSSLLNYLIVGFKVLCLFAGALLPLVAIGYVSLFIDPQMQFHSHVAHEIAISIAIITLSFVSLVGYKNYRQAENSFQRFLTLAVLGFVLIYAPHGVLTRQAGHNPILFLIFGPASRLIASIYLFIGFLNYHAAPAAGNNKSGRWSPHILLFLLIDAILFLATTMASVLGVVHLKTIESISICFFVLCFLVLVRSGGPSIWFYRVAVLLFIQAGAAFLLSRPWNHMWWLAHAISATGFFILGYAIMQTYGMVNAPMLENPVAQHKA